jgi:hypothetical protein
LKIFNLPPLQKYEVEVPIALGEWRASRTGGGAVVEVGYLDGLSDRAAFKARLPTGLAVGADPDPLFRVLLNLVRNTAQALMTRRLARFPQILAATYERPAAMPARPGKVRNSVIFPAQFCPSRASNSPAVSARSMPEPTNWLR